jgi:hypothetical protein
MSVAGFANLANGIVSRAPPHWPSSSYLAAGYAKNRLKPGLRTALGNGLRGS